MKLPDVSEIKSRIVPSKLTEEEFEAEMEAFSKRAGGLASESAIAMQVASKYGLNIKLSSRERKDPADVNCIQDADEYCNIDIVILRKVERDNKRREGETYLLANGIDKDYCYFTIWDWDKRLEKVEIGQGVKLSNFRVRSRDGKKSLSSIKGSKVALNNRQFEVPQSKHIKDFRDNELVRIKGLAVMGSYRESESGTIRVDVVEGDDWVTLAFYKHVVEKLINEGRMGDVEFDQLDQCVLDVWGKYVFSQTRSYMRDGERVTYTNENFIVVEDAISIEKVWGEGQDTPINTGRKQTDDAQSDERGQGKGKVPPEEKTPEINTEDLQKHIDTAFHISDIWGKDEFVAFLGKKLGDGGKALMVAMDENLIDVSGTQVVKKEASDDTDYEEVYKTFLKLASDTPISPKSLAKECGVDVEVVKRVFTNLESDGKAYEADVGKWRAV